MKIYVFLAFLLMTACSKPDQYATQCKTGRATGEEFCVARYYDGSILSLFGEGLAVITNSVDGEPESLIIANYGHQNPSIESTLSEAFAGEEFFGEKISVKSSNGIVMIPEYGVSIPIDKRIKSWKSYRGETQLECKVNSKTLKTSVILCRGESDLKFSYNYHQDYGITLLGAGSLGNSKELSLVDKFGIFAKKIPEREF